VADLRGFFTYLRKMDVEKFSGEGLSKSFWQFFWCFGVDLAETVFKNLPFFTFFPIFSAFLPFFPKNDHDLTLFEQK